MGDHTLMRTLFVMVLALCAGCSTGGGDGPNSASCLTTHGYDYDVVGETGLLLRATTPEYTFITFEEMEAEYKDVEACVVNTNTPGPEVRFINFDTTTEYAFQLKYALYYYALQTVFIDTATEDRPQRNCISDREFLRHEFTHHILYLNGEDPTHTNPKFEQCNALGPKTCNGQYCED